MVKKVNIPSYQVKMGDVITFKMGSKLEKKVEDFMNAKKTFIPTASEHTYYDKDKKELKVLRDPDVFNIKQTVDAKLIVEFYSR